MFQFPGSQASTYLIDNLHCHDNDQCTCISIAVQLNGLMSYYMYTMCIPMEITMSKHIVIT